MYANFVCTIYLRLKEIRIEKVCLFRSGLVCIIKVKFPVLLAFSGINEDHVYGSCVENLKRDGVVVV